MKIPKNHHGIWILTQCLSPYMRLLQVCWLHFWCWFVLYYRGSISESQLMSKVVSPNALALLSYIERLFANAFWNSEVEAELREANQVDFPFHSNADHERAMEMIDRKKASTPYSQEVCSDECKKRDMYDK